MSESFEIKVEGLEELERDLKAAIKKAPAQAEKTLLQLGRKFKNSAKKRAIAELNPHEREGDEKKKAIEQKWGCRLVEENLGAAVLVWNSARHFHLIESGHNIVRGGKVVGFVPGKHIMEKTKNEFEDVVPKRFRQMVDDILKESDLD